MSLSKSTLGSSDKKLRSSTTPRSPVMAPLVAAWASFRRLQFLKYPLSRKNFLSSLSMVTLKILPLEYILVIIEFKEFNTSSSSLPAMANCNSFNSSFVHFSLVAISKSLFWFSILFLANSGVVRASNLRLFKAVSK